MPYRSLSHRTRGNLLAIDFFAWAGLFGIATLASTLCVRADVVAYLINVTVRPGYNFANADVALSYGHGICDRLPTTGAVTTQK
jgi:hypothetical protein